MKYVSHEQTAKENAIQMIKNGEATCVLVKDNRIVSAESPKGIAYVLDLYDKGMLKGVFVADTIIGKAAAMVFANAGVKECYGRTISRAGLSWLEKRGISVTYDECADMIQNRKGDGMCPMESTVKEIFDEEEAIIALKNKVNELRENHRQTE